MTPCCLVVGRGVPDDHASVLLQRLQRECPTLALLRPEALPPLDPQGFAFFCQHNVEAPIGELVLDHWRLGFLEEALTWCLERWLYDVDLWPVLEEPRPIREHKGGGRPRVREAVVRTVRTGKAHAYNFCATCHKPLYPGQQYIHAGRTRTHVSCR